MMPAAFYLAMPDARFALLAPTDRPRRVQAALAAKLGREAWILPRPAVGDPVWARRQDGAWEEAGEIRVCRVSRWTDQMLRRGG
jgi:hypothetical protein